VLPLGFSTTQVAPLAKTTSATTMERYPSAMKAARRHFTLEGHHLRAERLKRDGPRDRTPLLNDLIEECQRRS
jgi:hypothetical protein